MENIDTTCRLCGRLNNSAKLVSVLDYDEDEQSAEPNLLQKIRNCLPVEISAFDAFPKKVCEPCCSRTHSVYEFIETVLNTQKTLTERLDTRSQIQTNKSKVTKRLTNRLQFENLPKRTQNVQKSHTPAEVIEKLQKYCTRVTISKLIQPPKEQKHFHAFAKDPLKLEDGIKQTSRDQNGDATKRAVEEDDEDVVDDDEDDEDYDADEMETAAYLEDVLMEEDDEDGADEDYKPRGSCKRAATKQPDPRRADKVVIVKMNSPAAYVCMTCKHKFDTFEQLKTHMITSQRCKEMHLTCDRCGKVCTTRKALYQHQVTHRDKFAFVCDKCGKTYTNRFNLENHKSSVHGERVEEFGSIYKCKICEAQFNNRADLYEHIKFHAKMPTVHLCDTCGKSYPSLESLRSHIRIHADIRPFRCTFCDKSFRARLHLTQHQHIHTGVKPFVCDACGRAFAKKGSLVSHSRQHSGDRPYQCVECPERFASPSKLRTHLKNHTDFSMAASVFSAATTATVSQPPTVLLQDQ